MGPNGPGGRVRRPTHSGPPPQMHHPAHGPGPPGPPGHQSRDEHDGPPGGHNHQHFTGSEDAIRRIHAQSINKFAMSERASFNTKDSAPDSDDAMRDGDQGGGGYFDDGEQNPEQTPDI